MKTSTKTGKTAKKTNTSNVKAFVVGAKHDTLRAIMLDAVKGQKVVDKTTNSISNRILEAAKEYQSKDKVGTVDDNNAEKFLTASKGHEDFIKSKEAGRNQVDTLPRCYTQAKSNIKAALILGVDLRAYSTESALRKDVAKARKALAGTDPVKAALAVLKKDLEGLSPDVALDLINQLNELAHEAIAELVPNEPVKSVDEQIAEQLKVG